VLQANPSCSGTIVQMHRQRAIVPGTTSTPEPASGSGCSGLPARCAACTVADVRHGHRHEQGAWWHVRQGCALLPLRTPQQRANAQSQLAVCRLFRPAEQPYPLVLALGGVLTAAGREVGRAGVGAVAVRAGGCFFRRSWKCSIVFDVTSLPAFLEV